MSKIFHPLLALIASATDRELARYVQFLKEENQILRTKHHLPPRSISFKGTIQTLEAFQPVIAMQGSNAAARRNLYELLLDAITAHRVGDRPDRFEPRVRKRRPKPYASLRKPRATIKREMAKRVR